ncbi:serine/threonine-protein kinase [Paludisphaera borealis]|uniref:Serine/threonine-protein kinase PrkC n=1 Tax=Paludisphaera borealis TaxID=1387353 RepID=A0A1U7CYX3_9BACT|nr:serine/threonine-protein kinase [Paludisphaera borealis]APW64162.1 Serine/threonine-protein kinase PrkC [Paludisphaera borealis]
MVDPQTSRFWQASLQSGLIDAQGLAACWGAIPEEKRDAREHLDRRLARQAVQLRLLTLWQAQQLLAGRSSGFRVDRYLMLDLIGHGGMGRVYLARDTRLNRLVALKILAPERMNNPRAIARFQREARVGAQLQHENLVRIYDFGESQGRYFLVMEFIEGKTIGAQIAAEGRLAPAVAARLTRQIALGLDHAHRKGLIHRDVNPYNVMVTNDGVAKLADLGLAIDMAEEGRVTREGATVGTFDYVAPEQARHSHSADIRSDIYSLGCSIYHMIAGQVPFPSPSLPEKLFSHQALEPTPLVELAPEVPAGLAEIVAKMMRKLPTDRYESPQQVVQALEPFLDDSTTIPAFDATSAPAGPPSVRTDSAVPPSESQVQAAAATSVSGQLAPSEEFPVVVDLGPEPSLAGSVSRAKPWFSGSLALGALGALGKTPSTTSLATPAPTPTPDPNLSEPPPPYSWRDDRRVVLGAPAAALVLVAAILGIAIFWRGTPTTPSVHPRSTAGAGSDSGGTAIGSKSQPVGVADGKESPIVVIDQDGEEAPATDLFQAMQAALGNRGTVVLRNREPLMLQAGDKAITIKSTGTLRLQAARGIAPVLKIDMKGQKPFLSTGPSVNLLVEGLTFEVFDSGPTPGKAAPPVVLALGRARFDHCALRTNAAGRLADSRAIVSEGGSLTVDGSWFEGFAAAIEIRAMAGSKNTVRQTMIVPGRPPAEAAQSGRAGWGVRVQFLGGGAAKAKRELGLEHCTFAGEGFLGLAGFSAQSPLSLVVNDCAVQADALVRWEPSKPDVLFDASAVRWSGEGNQFDVAGKSWIVPPPGAAPTVADLDGWMKLAPERDPVRTAILFPLEPRTAAGGPTPQAYAVAPTGARRPGADPAEVGPRP